VVVKCAEESAFVSGDEVGQGVVLTFTAAGTILALKAARTAASSV
jgi:hypothetical protein